MIYEKMPRWIRFIVGGGMNTLSSYILYLLFKQIISYQAAYLLSYMIGIVFSYWFNSRWVFHVPLNWSKFFSYPIVYATQYILSALLLTASVKYLNVNENIAPLIVIFFTVPLTYLLSKFILTRKKSCIPQNQ